MEQLERALMEDHDLLIEMHGMVLTLHNKLMGNGQPGLLHDVASLQTEVKLLKTQVPTGLERKTAAGSMVGVIFVMAGVIAKLLGIPLPGLDSQ